MKKPNKPTKLDTKQTVAPKSLQNNTSRYNNQFSSSSSTSSFMSNSELNNKKDLNKLEISCTKCAKKINKKYSDCSCYVSLCNECLPKTTQNSDNRCLKCVNRFYKVSKDSSPQANRTELSRNSAYSKLNNYFSPIERFNLNNDNMKERHKQIIEGYHVKVCESNIDHKCPFDFFKCFDSHEANYIRRKPSRTSSGWNYSPDICLVLEKNLVCPDKNNCVYSHSNDERIYHPEKFKKTICNFYTANTPCPRGDFCFKSHGKEDLSTLEITNFDIKNNNNNIKPEKSDKIKTSATRSEAKFSYHTDFLKMTVHNATTDGNFYMFEYKTKPCLNVPCNNMRCCTNYHHDQERRRSPKNFRYSAEPCPAVKLPTNSNGQVKWREPSRCEKLVLCEFSHTLLEQMYHPHIYKTSLCSNFMEQNNDNVRQNCLWGNLCTHAHGKNDLRQRADQTKIFDFSKFKNSATMTISKITGKVTDKSRGGKPSSPKNRQSDKLAGLTKPSLSFSEALRNANSGANDKRKQNLSSSKNKVTDPLMNLSNNKINEEESPEDNKVMIQPVIFMPKTLNTGNKSQTSQTYAAFISGTKTTSETHIVQPTPLEAARFKENENYSKELKSTRNKNSPPKSSSRVPKSPKSPKPVKSFVKAVKCVTKPPSPKPHPGSSTRRAKDDKRSSKHKPSKADDNNNSSEKNNDISLTQKNPPSKELEITPTRTQILPPTKESSSSEINHLENHFIPETNGNNHKAQIINVKKYFSPVIGPNQTAILKDPPPLEEADPPYCEPPQRHLEKPYDFFSRRLNPNSDPTHHIDRYSTQNHSISTEPSQTSSLNNIFNAEHNIFNAENNIFKAENNIFKAEEDHIEQSTNNGFNGFNSVPISQQPLQIVQDSPMFQLYESIPEKGGVSTESMLIDYKELFENLRKRYVCPLCRSSKALRSDVMVPCGHFFCNSCVAGLKENNNVSEEGFRCPQCEEMCSNTLKLAFE